MNPSPRASNSHGKSQRNAVAFELIAARKMLPLVKSIMADIAQNQQTLSELNPEKERLERNRRELNWSDRERRYELEELIHKTEASLTNATLELEQLGLSLVDTRSGLVDFPTRINGRTAAFSWQPSEDNILFWHYQGERQRRPIPPEWNDANALTV